MHTLDQHNRLLHHLAGIVVADPQPNCHAIV